MSIEIDNEQHDQSSETSSVYYRMEDYGRIDSFTTMPLLIATLCDGHNSLSLSPFHKYGGYECAKYVANHINEMVIGCLLSPSKKLDVEYHGDDMAARDHPRFLNPTMMKDSDIAILLKNTYATVDKKLCSTMLKFPQQISSSSNIFDSRDDSTCLRTEMLQAENNLHPTVAVHSHPILSSDSDESNRFHFPLSSSQLTTSYWNEKNEYDRVSKSKQTVLARHFPSSPKLQSSQVRVDDSTITKSVDHQGRWCSRVGLLHRSRYEVNDLEGRPLVFNGMCFIDDHNKVIGEPEFGCTSTTICIIPDPEEENNNGDYPLIGNLRGDHAPKRSQARSARAFVANVGDSSAYLFPFNHNTGKYDYLPFKLTTNHDMSCKKDVDAILKKSANKARRHEFIPEDCDSVEKSDRYMVGVRSTPEQQVILTQEDKFRNNNGYNSDDSLLPRVKKTKHQSKSKVTISATTRRYCTSLTRSFGHASFWKHHGMSASPSIHSCMVNPMDVIVVATDGFWLEDESISKQKSPSDSSSTILTTQNNLLLLMQDLLSSSVTVDDHRNYIQNMALFGEFSDKVMSWSLSRRLKNYYSRQSSQSVEYTTNMNSEPQGRLFRQDNATVLSFVVQ
jgi:serine/threonine protein phosphatase PrpC